MTRTLPSGVRCYRIGDPDGKYPIFDTTGATLAPGRWNTATSPMLYTAEHYSTAMLEKLVHGSGFLPRNQHYLEIVVPAGVTYEVFGEAHHPGWEAADAAVAKAFGHAWQRSKRSCVLFVPSVVARMEKNVLVNMEHPEAHRIERGLEAPIWWDARLFSSSATPAARPRSKRKK